MTAWEGGGPRTAGCKLGLAVEGQGTMISKDLTAGGVGVLTFPLCP